MVDSNEVGAVLRQVGDQIMPWGTAEVAAREAADDHPIYLGGDGLRPYASWIDGETAFFSLVERDHLPPPPLLAEVRSGAFGLPLVSRSGTDQQTITLKIRLSDELRERLTVPEVGLIGLADAERYRGARLSLGIARLAQWLRFAHSARVTVLDYNFSDDALSEATTLVSQPDLDILGISVNFGQLRLLEELAAVVNREWSGPVILGNIVAAHSPAEVTAMFDRSRIPQLYIATSLGEQPMEELCRSHSNPSAWSNIVGLRAAEDGMKPSPTPELGVPELVFPDESLVLNVADREGQISFESSFGCQFGACTFCPRDHKGEGWDRGETAVVQASLERLAPLGSALSLVDEEFFGSEGLVDPPLPDLPAAAIMTTSRKLGMSYEFYTRLEQIFDRRRSRAWNLERARLLATEAPAVSRLFVGVESGSPTQLQRYGKGQTVKQMVDALGVASAMGLPLEFGFITFDPLLKPTELLENLQFLARDDILSESVGSDPDESVKAVSDYLDGAPLPGAGIPIFQQVAYMATEMEVLRHSRYAERLRRSHLDLLTGEVDPNFARIGALYRDERISEIAGWCRVWTEGMFSPVYEARMAARSSTDPSAIAESRALVSRYREATFGLLVSVSMWHLEEIRDDLDPLLPASASLELPDHELMNQMAEFTLGVKAPVRFDLGVRSTRRIA